MRDWLSFAPVVDAVRAGLKKLAPRALVVPEGNSPMNELVHRVARALSIRTVCVQQGWSPLVHSGFRNLSYSAMCVWGEAFADALRPYNRRQKFVATGNHVVKLRSSSEAALRPGIGFFAQKGSRLITDAAWRGFIDLARWTAERFPDLVIYVREHPGSPLSSPDIAALGEAKNVRLAPPSEIGLDDLLAKCRVVVSIFSTTLFEGLAVGALPIIVNVTGMARFNPDLANENAAIEVSDYDAAQRAIAEALGGASMGGLDRQREKYFAADREAALNNIVSVIQGP
jgi:hypothetical protein